MSRIDASVMAFLVTVVSILVLRPIAHLIGLVDHPGGRKQHDGIVPSGLRSRSPSSSQTPSV
jgi:UDP-N-acetylmuramyl pentapeptide phosphotransferase/UDP-N-acetylglucosamine-1-phosphate transferase